MIEVTILSVLQGIAEFLPISSSGHLVLGKHFLGMGEMGMRLDVFLHVGTLFSILVFYFSIIRRIVINLEWKYLLKIVVSAIPVGIVGVLFNDQLDAAFSSTRMVGVALLFTGFLLTITRFLPKGDKDISFGRALLMGLAQMVAIFPGVSRSGMTIAAARSMRVEGEKCAEFSFLMSAPPIAGAALLELVSAMKVGESVNEVSWGLTLYGGLVAAVVGYFSLKLLVSSLKGRWFWLFGPYCLIMGTLALIFG